MDLVRPKSTFNSTAVNEWGVVLCPSDVLRATNPHVLANPDLFEPVRETVPPFADDVEQATANPGQKRRR